MVCCGGMDGIITQSAVYPLEIMKRHLAYYHSRLVLPLATKFQSVRFWPSIDRQEEGEKDEQAPGLCILLIYLFIYLFICCTWFMYL